MKKILVIIAMEEEARPIIKQLELREVAVSTDILSNFPRFRGIFEDKEIMISLSKEFFFFSFGEICFEIFKKP